MTRIAILGGGISGLTAAYELELARRCGAAIDWHLYEATDRLGGIVETTRHTTAEGEYILEGGPDAWISQKPSEKPWAREFTIELGLEADLIYSNDATRRTYILMPEAGTAGKLQPIPGRMRLMVPDDLATLEDSPLFSPAARAAYAAEPNRADELKRTALDRPDKDRPDKDRPDKDRPGKDRPGNQHTDESVADFTLRHFGPEVLTTLAAPLLSGIFGGDVYKLSVRAVMPAFVAMEREHGSLIAALQVKSAQRTQPPQPIFTSLRNGVGSLTTALTAHLPPERLHLQRAAKSLKRERNLWCLRTASTTPARAARVSKKHFNHVLLATSLDSARKLVLPLDRAAAELLPADASSAILATLCWSPETARTFAIPGGFGFLVPHSNNVKNCYPEPSEGPASPRMPEVPQPQLLACTFVDQKFPHRCPPGARIVRVFFGGPAADTLAEQSDEAIAATALTQLQAILGPLPAPDPTLTTIRRWPRSLPQYEVGHLDRMAELDNLVAEIPGLTLLGNSYRGVGLPDLIRDARIAARKLTTCPR